MAPSGTGKKGGKIFVAVKIKRDGHTHTHYCLHGSGEQAEEFVLKAIAEGFQVYSFTEHLPFPEKYMAEFPYPDEVKAALGFLNNDLDGYFREMLALKKKYQDQIELLVGLEIDYLPSEHVYLREMLREYGPFLQDGLLSVHIMQGQNGWRCLDLSPADFQEGLLTYYGSYEKVQLAYYALVKEAVLADLGPHKPRRIAHLTLCNKFQHYFGQAGRVSKKIKEAVGDLLNCLKERGYSLDFNVSGLYREYCREVYPSPWIIKRAQDLKIPLIYGSDAHSVKNVGRDYGFYQQMMGGAN